MNENPTFISFLKKKISAYPVINLSFIFSKLSLPQEVPSFTKDKSI